MGGFGRKIPGSNTQENSVWNASQEEIEGLALEEKAHQWAHGRKSKGKGAKTEGLEGTQPGSASILPGLLVEEENRPKAGPMDNDL